MSPSERTLLAHLYNRAGFGATKDELNEAELKGWDACVEELIAGLAGSGGDPPPAPKMARMPQQNNNMYNEFMELVDWWVDTMVTTANPLREKLVLLLHNQFPTAISGVGWASMMYDQNQLFRTHGTGPFDVLMRVVSKDPAMMLWLNTAQDVAQSPNENYARELMERFTLGIGHYTQSDVHNGARAFCGWTINYHNGQFMLQDWAIDNNMKTFLGVTGDLDGYDIVNIVTHQPACAPYVTSRLWSWLAYPVTPDNPVVADLAPAFAKGLNVGDLIASMLRHPAFVSEQALAGLVKQPAEYIVGTMRRLGLTSKDFQQGQLDGILASLGQELFNPPNVGGWGHNGYWLSTASSLARLQVAYGIAQVADVSELEEMPVWARIEWIANHLGIAFTERTLEALSVMRDYPQQLLALALISPEYVVN